MQPSTHIVPADAATTCSSQWRHDARVIGSPPFRAVGSLGPRSLSLMPSTLVREHLFSVTSGSQVAFSLGCQPGSSESAPCVTWSVLGSPPLSSFHHCTGQVATDPLSPKGGCQRACPTGGAHPTASGRLKGVALIKQSALLWQLRSHLFGLPAREF